MMNTTPLQPFKIYHFDKPRIPLSYTFTKPPGTPSSTPQPESVSRTPQTESVSRTIKINTAAKIPSNAIHLDTRHSISVLTAKGMRGLKVVFVPDAEEDQPNASPSIVAPVHANSSNRGLGLGGRTKTFSNLRSQLSTPPPIASSSSRPSISLSGNARNPHALIPDMSEIPIDGIILPDLPRATEEELASLPPRGSFIPGSRPPPFKTHPPPAPARRHRASIPVPSVSSRRQSTQAEDEVWENLKPPMTTSDLLASSQPPIHLPEPTNIAEYEILEDIKRHYDPSAEKRSFKYEVDEKERYVEELDEEMEECEDSWQVREENAEMEVARSQKQRDDEEEDGEDDEETKMLKKRLEEAEKDLADPGWRGDVQNSLFVLEPVERWEGVHHAKSSVQHAETSTQHVESPQHLIEPSPPSPQKRKRPEDEEDEEEEVISMLHRNSNAPDSNIAPPPPPPSLPTETRRRTKRTIKKEPSEPIVVEKTEKKRGPARKRARVDPTPIAEPPALAPVVTKPKTTKKKKQPAPVVVEEVGPSKKTRTKKTKTEGEVQTVRKSGRLAKRDPTPVEEAPKKTRKSKK